MPMKRNVAKMLIAMGASSALALAICAPALADEADAAEHPVASAVSNAAENMGAVLDDAVSDGVSGVALLQGQAVAAEDYSPALAPDAGWMTCGASTYGIGDGLMGSGCADGSVVTEDSRGVAHKTLALGTKIQIVYNGTVVNATVCDRGPYIAGRDIDLQPAIANALGFDGVGQLQYRILS